MKSFNKHRKSIILADCEKEEVEEFAEGFKAVTGDEIFINSKICNGSHGKAANFRRYFIYAVYPFYFVMKSRQYKYVIGWQQFFALFYVFYCRLFHIKKRNIVIAVNFTYKSKAGFAGKIYKRFMGYCVRNKYLDYIHVLSYNYAKICAKEFGISKNKFIVTPFGIPDTYEKWKKTKVEYNNYSFSIGRSNRDFDFLVNAWGRMPENELLVIASDTFCPKKKLPVNVIHRRDIIGDAQFPYIANCKAMIIPIDDGTICSGDTVLLKAMSYEKLVAVTVPSTLGEMYIDDGKDGLLIKKDLKKFVDIFSKEINSDSAKEIGISARKSFLKKFSRYAMGKNLCQLLIYKREINYFENIETDN